ncbi:hypothetical protein [Hymenobacter actinosclerus]|nr:hypothetical protein [Hymenobacter actinosclerus]
MRPALDRTVAAGPRQLPLDLSGLAAGDYYCQVRGGRRSSSLLLAVE